MDLDEALKKVGPIGRTQFLVVAISGLLAMQLSFLVLSTVFIAETPPHHCTLCMNCTVDGSIPIIQDGGFSRCREYVDDTYKNVTQSCSNGWEYELSLHGKSIVSDWNLVCDKDSLPGLSQSIMVLGFGLGCLLSGIIADKYGRRRITFASLIIFNVLGISVSFSPNYIVFVTLRFLMATVFRGAQLPSLILMFEYLTPKHLPTFGNIPSIVLSVALIPMAWMAYGIRDWRLFHAVLMTPSILTMLIIWAQPESVRWLISQRRYQEAEERMQEVAKFNRVKDFPSPALNFPTATVVTKGSGAPRRDDDAEIKAENEEQDRSKGHSSSILQLFKPPVNLVTFTLSWLWASFYLMYFGFGLSTGSLAGDPYMNFFLGGLAELPARIIPIIVLKRFGNLIPLMAYQVLAGLCMIAIIFTPSNTDYGWLITAFALLGRFFTVCIFAPVNVVTAELLPTTIRTLGRGFALFIGNIGSILAPLLLYADNFVPNVSFMIMASSTFISALLCLLLPESRGQIQPETPEDLQELIHSKRLLVCRRRASRQNSSKDVNDNNKIMSISGKDNVGLELGEDTV